MKLYFEELKSKFINLSLRFFKSLNRLLKRKAFKIFLLILVIIASVFLISTIIIKTSKPGDLFFTVKAFIEEKQLSINKNKTNIYLSILQDRVDSYYIIDNQNQCVQLLLANQEVINSLKKFNISNINPLNKVSDITKILNSHSNYQIKCNNQSSVLQYLSCLYSDLDFYYSNNLVQKNTLTKGVSDLQHQYNESISKFEAEVITDQNMLNQVESLLILTKNNIKSINDSLTSNKNLFNSYLDLLSSNFALETIQDITKNNNFNNQIITICYINKDLKECSPSNISSLINSINGKNDLSSQIQLGENSYKKYLSLVLTDYKIIL